jgi:hypothetical protein
MRTQSADTALDAERMMIKLIRGAPMSKRFKLVQSLTQSALWTHIHAWQGRYREASEADAAVHLVSRWYGFALAQRVQIALDQRAGWHIQPADLLAVISPALHAFEDFQVTYYLGGSVASSLHGMQQAARDIDLIVDLHRQPFSSLLPLLKQHYILDEDEADKAVRECTIFQMIHLDSLMKVDLIFPKTDAFNIFMRQLVSRHALSDGYPPFPIASANEMILFKLQRYQHNERTRTDGMRDDAEWNDILGMLKVQGSALDLALLEKWARRLDMIHTLSGAFIDAGLSEI